MAHTQGPWKIKFQESRWGTTDKDWHAQWVIKGPDNKHSPVATVRVAGYGMGPSMAVREANARLIAAAPDLFAALEDMLNLTLDEDDIAVSSRIVKARAAITKSRGARK
jgi:hypothetical protein